MVLDEQTPARARDLDVRRLLLQTQESLQAAVDQIHANPDAALDDLLAARLLVSTLLLKLQSPDGEAGVVGAALDGDQRA